MTADRGKRHLRILELVTTREIRTQEELARLLAELGWEVTQSSVSRDITALGLVKIDGVYRRPPRGEGLLPDSDERRIAEGLLAAEAAGDALVVLHTPPGEANRVGAALDRLAWPELLGTIAGDDTIFVAVRGRVGKGKLLRRLGELGK